MKKTTIAILTSSLLVLAACSPNGSANTTTVNDSKTLTTVSDGKALATVNGHAISKAHADYLVEMTKTANPGAEIDIAMVNDQIISQEVLAQEARKLGLDQSEAFKAQSSFTEKALLTSLLFDQFSEKNPVTDAEIQKEYDFINEQLQLSQKADSKQFNAYHILLETKEKAQDLIQKINAGAQFLDMAKEHSIEPGAAQSAGSLGWTSSTPFVTEFANALAAMEAGDVSKEPVQTQFGWHIIYVEDVREVEVPNNDMPELSDHIKDQLRGQLANKKFIEYESKLIDKAEIVKH